MSWTSLFSGGGDSSLNTWGNLAGSYNSGGSDGFDWGGTVSSIFDGSTSDGIDYSSLGGGGSSGGSWLNTAASLFGGSGGGGQGGAGGQGGGSIWESLLAGASGVAGQKMDEKTAREVGKQQRTTLDFTASLKDFYEQKNKVRKRAALDTYGQFSTMDRWAPNAVAAPPVDMPARPGVG